MFKKIAKITLPIVTACGIFASVFFIPTASATGANTIWLDPGSGTRTTGSQFTVTVKGNANRITGGEIRSNIVLRYPANLSVVAFNNGNINRSKTIHTASSRTLTFTHSDILILQPVSNATLFTVTFKANSAGAAPVTFTNKLFRGRNVNAINATYTINNPACPAGQVGTWPNCTTPPSPNPPAPDPSPSTPTPGGGGSSGGSSGSGPGSGSSGGSSSSPDPTPTPTPVDTDPVFKTFSANAKYDTIEFAWSTDVATTATLKYGASPDKLDQTAQVTPTQNSQSFTSKADKLNPGTTYHYEVVVKKSTGKTTSRTGRATTKKYPVVLTIVKDNMPFDKATITFDDDSVVPKTTDLVSNTSGEIPLTLMPGTFLITITRDEFSEEREFTVEEPSYPEGGTPNSQMITINLDKEDGESNSSASEEDDQDEVAAPASTEDSRMNIVALIVGGVIALLATGALLFFIIKKRQQNQNNNGGWSPLVEHDFNDIPPEGTAAAPNVDYAAYQNPIYETPSPMQADASGYYPTDPSIDPLADDADDLNSWGTPQYSSYDTSSSQASPDSYAAPTDPINMPPTDAPNYNYGAYAAPAPQETSVTNYENPYGAPADAHLQPVPDANYYPASYDQSAPEVYTTTPNQEYNQPVDNTPTAQESHSAQWPVDPSSDDNVFRIQH